MKVLRLIAFLLVAQLNGCVPKIYGVFHNSLPYSVTVTLLNPREQPYCSIRIPSGTVRRCDVQYGTALVADQTGKIIAKTVIVQPGTGRYFDFDRKQCYFDIKSSRLVPVAISEGIRWLPRQE